MPTLISLRSQTPMPKKLLICAIVFLVASCANKSSFFPQSSPYRENKPAVALRNDIESGNTHFLALEEFGLKTPGLDAIDRIICFPQVDTKVVEINQQAFGEYAYAEINYLIEGTELYASRYNELLKAQLQESGKSSCEPTEQWAKAYGELNRFIRKNAPQEGSGASMSGHNPPEFTISLSNPPDADEITNRACKIFAGNGIRRPVDFRLVEQQYNDKAWKQQPIARFNCRAGNRSALARAI